MSGNLLEDAARAAFERSSQLMTFGYVTPPATTEPEVVPPMKWEEVSESVREFWRQTTRAVIEAMSKPTPRMLDAGAFYHIKGAGAAGNVELGLAKDAWRAMIKAAIPPATPQSLPPSGDRSR